MLRLTRELFDELNKEGLRYCHWKSNSHIEAAVAGKTDLDILVDESQTSLFLTSLDKIGFKKVRSIPHKTYPGLSDYLGFDADAGRLVHLHIHYQMILGEQNVKSYHLSLEKLFLDNSMETGGIKMPLPELELIVLCIRSLLKYHLLEEIWRRLVGQDKGCLPRATMEEFDYLIKQCKEERLSKYLEKTHLGIPLNLILDLLNKVQSRQLRYFDLQSKKRIIESRLKPYRRLSKYHATIKYIKGRFYDLHIRKYFFLAQGKTLYKDGVIVGIVGADGAGKSALVRSLTDWLSWRLEVKSLYMGIPKSIWMKATGKATIYLRDLRKKLGKSCGEYSILFRSIFQTEQVFTSLRWWQIARYRHKKFLQARRFVRKGYIVITDRYPLKLFNSMKEPMDGARIKAEFGWRLNMFARILSRMEEKIYKSIPSPDCIFALVVSPDVASRRRPEVDKITLEDNIEAVNKIPGSNLPYRIIDANLKFTRVFMQTKDYLWELL